MEVGWCKFGRKSRNFPERWEGKPQRNGPTLKFLSMITALQLVLGSLRIGSLPLNTALTLELGIS